MRVVAASMHHAIHFGTVWTTFSFFDGQGIHVGAQRNAARVGIVPFYMRHHASAGNARLMLDAPFRQFLVDEPSSLNFLKTEFGMAVYLTSDVTHFFGKRCSRFLDGLL